MRRARIEVPASSANLGPGFDTLGIALDIVNTIEVDVVPDSDDVVIAEADGPVDVSLDPRENLVCRAYREWARDSETPLPGARFRLNNHIPSERGLGASAAALVGGLAAAAFATETESPNERILNLASALEGHPDNVAAATFGGITIAIREEAAVRAVSVVNHLSIGIALFVPDNPLPTQNARAALPTTVPLTDAVFNVGRAAYLVNELMWGRWETLAIGMEDRLHQPYRANLIPHLTSVVRAARDAGAFGAALSGGGPSVIAFAPRERADAVGQAMEESAALLDWQGKAIVTRNQRFGVSVRQLIDE